MGKGMSGFIIFLVIIVIVGLAVELTSPNILKPSDCDEFKNYSCVLVDDYTIMLGDDNTTFTYTFVCNPYTMIVNTNKNIEDINLGFRTNLKCKYIKIRNKE